MLCCFVLMQLGCVCLGVCAPILVKCKIQKNNDNERHISALACPTCLHVPLDNINLSVFLEFIAAHWEILLISRLCIILHFFFDHWTESFGLCDFHRNWQRIRLKSCSAGLVSYRMSLLSSVAPRNHQAKDLNAK